MREAIIKCPPYSRSFITSNTDNTIINYYDNNISGTGTIIANSTAIATAGMRKIFTSTSAPTGSDGAVGDLWVKY